MERHTVTAGKPAPAWTPPERLRVYTPPEATLQSAYIEDADEHPEDAFVTSIARPLVEAVQATPEELAELVRRWNSHAALVAACEFAAEWIENSYEPHDAGTVLERLLAALAAAKGGAA